MTYRVIITDAALAAVEKHLDHIDRQTGSTAVGERWWRRALKEVQSLKKWPSRCPIAPEDLYTDETIRACWLIAACFSLALTKRTASCESSAFATGLSNRSIPETDYLIHCPALLSTTPLMNQPSSSVRMARAAGPK